MAEEKENKVIGLACSITNVDEEIQCYAIRIFIRTSHKDLFYRYQPFVRLPGHVFLSRILFVKKIASPGMVTGLAGG